MFEFGRFAEPLRPSLSQHIRLAAASFAVDSLNSAAPGKDQDALLISEGFCAVADGATPLSGDGSDVADFSREALQALASNKTLSIEEMVRAGVQSLATKAQHRAGETPSCALAIARCNGQDIELSSLCDSFAVARLRNGRYVVAQNSAPPIDQKLNESMGNLLGQGMSIADARAEIFEILRQHRPRLMNRPGGYWVFADDPDVGRYAVVESIPAGDVDAILLATDGFGRLFDLFGVVAGPEALLDLAVREGLPELRRLLRRLELMPGSMRRHPRPSIQDDATAILMTRRVIP